MTCFNVLFFRNLVPFGGFFLVSISALFFSLFEFFSEAFSCDKISELKYSIPIETENVTAEKNKQTELDAIESKVEDSEFIEENESPKLIFKFQYQTQTFEGFRKKFEENETCNVGLDSFPCTITNKYEFNSENGLCCIMEKPEDLSFCVKESYADSSDGLSPEKPSSFEEDFVVDSSRNIEDQDIEGELRKLEEFDDQNKGSNALETSDCEDLNSLETLWEHQELIEQLKMELKKVKATGLPTILEESECPKIMDDLKPWKIDEKFQYADRMTELHKFYKSYRERMRKFDILNYQKMYAIGQFYLSISFLSLQNFDPFQSISSHKSSSAPAISSLLPQNLRLGRRKALDSDPMSKFINELHGDLEMVYGGQMVVSIRIFWQFIRADKDANHAIRKIRNGAQVEPLEPDELQLLATLQTSLQRKDKKLREALRSGKCMLRRLKKNEVDNSVQVLYFFSQVDLKLVERVLNMSKLAKDQLLWCHGKRLLLPSIVRLGSDDLEVIPDLFGIFSRSIHILLRLTLGRKSRDGSIPGVRQTISANSLARGLHASDCFLLLWRL
ncbi:putative 60S ribosomal protein L34 [Hibiscus syriacus]|uniref:60S ribosomal protein L34 n=1 Tax=Hibiscus syriacus TaxID=106335 RepID=A0A6A2WNV8_HIBSY|nr:putative 60S ribosomal protein L34 [Hibiscus syriacus]